MPVRDDNIGINESIQSNKPDSKRNVQKDKRNKKRGKGKGKGSSGTSRKYQITGVVKSITAGQDNPVNKITSDLVGASLTVTNPHTLVDTEKYPSTRYTLPTTYTTTISNVLNSTTFEVSEPYYAIDDTLQKIPVSLKDGSISITYDTYKTETENSTYQRSYANLTIGNLRTFSGDVYKAKVYTRDAGTSTDFEQIYDTFVVPENVLVDTNSVNQYENIGFFHTASIVDNNWVSSSTSTETSPFVTLNDDDLIDGLLISGSVFSIDDKVTFRTSQSFDLEQSVDYVVRFNTHYFKDLSERRDSNKEITEKKYASLKIYLSGSSITGTNGESDFFLGEVDVPDSANDEGTIPDVVGRFRTAGSGTPKAWLKFELNAGRFVIQDVSLEPFSETNFNPSFFKVLAPMPRPVRRGDKYDFLVEFYDSNNNIAETTAQVNGVTFAGPRQVVADGTDAVFTGSMIVGESIEMYGVNPAYLRSVGYNGFDNIISSNKGGFLLYSGSVGTPIGASETYDGVGLEIVDAHGSQDRYLKFGTNPSVFEVVTDTFFLGQSSGAFISGSNGKLQISSDNFSVSADGDVTASGFISASAGHIGNFTLDAGRISGSNITFDANNSTIFKTDQGPGSDTSAPFPYLRNEYYIDFTPEVEDPDNFFIKMGPNFMVDKDGILIASGATFQGSITASTGLIGGFSIGSASLFNGSEGEPNFFFSGSAVGTNFDKQNLFISASGFQVNSQGAISASSGQIGGFNINTNGLNSDSNEFQITGSTGQITGSSVLFNGGKIGGWTISNDTISSNNLILNSTGQITSKDYASNLKGFFLGPVEMADGSVGSFLEVDEARIRGTLKTTVFEKESVNAVGGQLHVANATTITGSATMSVDDDTMQVANASGFEAGEIILLKKFNSSGFTTEYMKIHSVSLEEVSDTNFSGSLVVTRSLGTTGGSDFMGALGASAQEYTPGQVVVSTGKNGTGYIRLNANPNDTSTPFIDIVERTGDGVYDIDLKARLGDLSGLSSALVGSNPGFGLFSENVFLTGRITSTEGSIGGWTLSANDLSSGNVSFNSNTERLKLGAVTDFAKDGSDKGILIGKDGSDYEFFVGQEDDNNIHWNGSTLSIDGTITATDGRIGGFYIGTNDIYAGNATLNNANTKIVIGNTDGTPKIALGGTADSITLTSGDGVFMDGGGDFRVGKANGSRIEFDQSEGTLIISSSKFLLGSRGIGKSFVSGSNGKLEISSSGYHLESDGNFNFGDGSLVLNGSTLTIAGGVTIGSTQASTVESRANSATQPGDNVSDLTNDSGYQNASDVNTADKTDGTVAGWSINSDEIKSNNNRIILHRDNSLNGQIKVGANASSMTLTSQDGIYMDGTGDFRVGDVDGARIEFDVSDSSLFMSSSRFFLGSGEAFISGSNGNLNIGAETFKLVATGSNNAGLLLDSSNSSIVATGSRGSVTGNSVRLLGDEGVIEVSQSGEGVFDTGRTKTFTTNTFIEPNVFKPGSTSKGYVSSSTSTEQAAPRMDNLDVGNIAASGLIDTNAIFIDTARTSTPFAMVNDIQRNDALSNPDGVTNPTASFAVNHTVNYTANTQDSNCHPAFTFHADYFTELADSGTNNTVGWVQNSVPSGSNIFTISTTARDVDNTDFEDAKFNILGLESNTSGLHANRQNEYTFLQAKHSGSIRLQIQHDGDVVSKGNITAFGASSNFLTVSDEREKKNIYTISESLDRIKELRPTKFTWKETNKQDVGFIAQEVEKIIPEVIETSRGFINIDDSKERKTIAYPKLVPYLVDTIQQLTKRIEELEKKVK